MHNVGNNKKGAKVRFHFLYKNSSRKKVYKMFKSMIDFLQQNFVAIQPHLLKPTFGVRFCPKKKEQRNHIRYPIFSGLIVNNNKLVSLPEEIGKMNTLMQLDASCNEITHLPVQIGDLASLKELNLRRNHLQEIPIGKIFPSSFLEKMKQALFSKE